MRVRPIASGEIALAAIAGAKAKRRDSAWRISAIGGRFYYVHRRDADRILRIVNDRRLDLLELNVATIGLRGVM